METITIPKTRFEELLQEVVILRNTSLYKRLLEFEENIKNDKRFSREDLGF